MSGVCKPQPEFPPFVSPVSLSLSHIHTPLWFSPAEPYHSRSPGRFRATPLRCGREREKISDVRCARKDFSRPRRKLKKSSNTDADRPTTLAFPAGPPQMFNEPQCSRNVFTKYVTRCAGNCVCNVGSSPEEGDKTDCR